MKLTDFYDLDDNIPMKLRLVLFRQQFKEFSLL